MCYLRGLGAEKVFVGGGGGGDDEDILSCYNKILIVFYLFIFLFSNFFYINTFY